MLPVSFGCLLTENPDTKVEKLVLFVSELHYSVIFMGEGIKFVVEIRTNTRAKGGFSVLCAYLETGKVNGDVIMEDISRETNLGKILDCIRSVSASDGLDCQNFAFKLYISLAKSPPEKFIEWVVPWEHFCPPIYSFEPDDAPEKSCLIS
jgi:hypothetical protein